MRPQALVRLIEDCAGVQITDERAFLQSLEMREVGTSEDRDIDLADRVIGITHHLIDAFPKLPSDDLAVLLEAAVEIVKINEWS